MTISVEFKDGWIRTTFPQIIYLVLPAGEISFISDSLELVNIDISALSYLKNQTIDIIINGETVFSSILFCDIFKKISFNCIVNRGENNVNVITRSERLQNNDNNGGNEIVFFIAIKDFTITRQDRIKII